MRIPAYIRYERLPWIQDVFYGVGAAVIAIIAQSAYLCVANLASVPEIRDFLGRTLQFVDRFTGPNSR
jgi:chromate transport protein ChrA